MSQASVETIDVMESDRLNSEWSFSTCGDLLVCRSQKHSFPVLGKSFGEYVFVLHVTGMQCWTSMQLSIKCTMISMVGGDSTV